MSITKISRVGGAPIAWAPTWTRPADWLTLPTLIPGTEKIVLLVHASPNAVNAVGISVAGGYTVDWGDGTAAQNFASGATASHNYDYTALPAGTITSEGKRQAIATVTMQAGQSLTSVTMTILPTGTSGGYIHPIYEMSIVGASISTLILGASGAATPVPALRWVTFVGTMNVTAPRLTSLTQLRGISGTQWTANATDLTAVFQNCYNLEAIPTIDTSKATTLSTAFQFCYRLRSLPLLNTSLVTSMANMFTGCSTLTNVPLFDTSKVTSMTGMFTSCSSLTTVPLFVTTAVTTMASMFQTCPSLRSVPAFDTSNCTAFDSMFLSCLSLNSTGLPASFNTVKGVSFGSMFSGCISLDAHPALDVSNGITFSSMFSGCTSLTAVTLNCGKGTTFSSIFSACQSLQTINVDFSLAVTITGLISNTQSLRSVILTGLRFGISSVLTSQQLSTAALNALYTSLGTASGAQTLIVTANPGSGSSTISIATAKGWTVSGG